MLLPSRALAVRIDALCAELGASLVVLDPALPVGHLGPSLAQPYALVLHGAEVTVPARLAPTRPLLARTLRGASLLIAAGGYPAAEARRVLGAVPRPFVIVPPGVDATRFHPLDLTTRAAVRARLGVDADAPLVVSVSRLVPRKGMDVLIEAAARLAPSHPGLTVLIGGSGRDRERLDKLVAQHGAPVRLLGRVPDDELPELLGAADLEVMLCRNRWLGLEQEGFGIVFLEAAACAVAQVAGLSGGAHEAVEDEVTGLVVDRPADVVVASAAIARILDDAALRRRLGDAARTRAAGSFDYDALAGRLDAALRRAEAGGV
jgi:phosphatidylinositol alpha-1,6-mannosyltransferase